jgi:hypothetical protein
MFAKLTSAKLTSTRLASHRGSCPAAMLPVAPAHANDNHVTRHDRGGTAGRPVLTCRWIPAAAGGLECRWFLAGGEGAQPGESGKALRAQPPAAAGGRHLALVARRAHRAP